VLSSFGVPALLAGSGLFFPDATMLAPEVITQILGRGDLGAGAALATIMLVPSFGLFVFQDWYVRNRSFVTVTGAPGSFEPRPVPPAVRWACFAVCALVSLLILALYSVIAAGAITRTWGVNYSLTGQHLQLMLSVGAESIRNSLVLSAAGALLATIFGTLAAYVLSRWQFPGARTLDFVAMLPYALPGVVMGLGYAAGFNVGLIVLTGTWAIILLNYAIRRFPFAVQGGKAALAQIDRSLEEAAADLGASWLRTFWRVTLPLLRTTFVAGVTFSFIKAMTDITAVIFLVSPHWRLMSVDVYNYITAGRLGVAAAMSTLMVVLILGFLVALWRVTGLGYSLLKD
jgi:iron(III) transport system permease protein